jgi:hypothetical protein
MMNNSKLIGLFALLAQILNMISFVTAFLPPRYAAVTGAIIAAVQAFSDKINHQSENSKSKIRTKTNGRN